MAQSCSPITTACWPADPKNATLIYLRGRIDPDARSRDAYYHRASRPTPSSPGPGLPWVRRPWRGQWEEALRCLDKAQELHIEDNQISDLIHTVRLATGDASKLVDEYRRRGNGVDMGTMSFLCEALAAADQSDAIEPAVTAWMNTLPFESRAQLSGLSARLRSTLRASLMNASKAVAGSCRLEKQFLAGSGAARFEPSSGGGHRPFAREGLGGPHGGSSP